MTRPRKATVDYFPHQCTHGETMFILEQRWGNEGYAFWFKLLELLGRHEGHFLDCKKPATMNYLAAKTLVTTEKAHEILNLLAELEAIDTELWSKATIIWSDNFVKGLAFAYRNREVSIPDKPVLERKEPGICGTPDVRNPQMKVNEMKGKKRKEKYISIPEDFSISEAVRKWAEKNGYDQLEKHLESFIDYAKSNAKQYADWDATFRRAIREDWGKIRTQFNGKPKMETPEWVRDLKRPSSA